MILNNQFIISCREKGRGYSEFIEVHSILNSQDRFKIWRVYQQIFLNINSYESTKIDHLEKLEIQL